MSTMHQEEQGGEEDRALEELRGHLAGSVIQPEDPLYDEARAVWTGMIDLRPRAIVRAGAVGTSMPCCPRPTNRPAVAVRGGGGMRPRRGRRRRGAGTEPAERGRRWRNRLVTVGTGATLKDVDGATAPHGLAVPLGVISATGVAGLTLGGGVGG